MDKLVFSCFLLGGLTPAPGPTDSCALNSYCTAGVTNVGCNPPPTTGGSACNGKSAQVVQLLEEEQTRILYRLNNRRNSIASGEAGNDKADHMFTLQWDANLATQAGHNARSCIVARDACRNTADYANVGQMVATYSGSTDFLGGFSTTSKIDNVFITSINYYQYLYGSGRFSSYSASTNTENEANIVNDRSKKVGCAAMQWTVDNQITFYLVCNFSANVIEGKPIYMSAATAGTGCATKDMTNMALCLT